MNALDFFPSTGADHLSVEVNGASFDTDFNQNSTIYDELEDFFLNAGSFFADNKLIGVCESADLAGRIRMNFD